jgi:hypothetical protein
MTVLIGPQATGKSVISKLFYFFIHQLHNFQSFAEDGKTPTEIIEEIASNFYKWFPPAAWGSKTFQITFTLRDEAFVIKRRRPSSAGPSEKISVTISEFFQSHYQQLFDEYQSVRHKLIEKGSELDLSLHRSWEIDYKIRVAADRRLEKTLGQEWVNTQLFIPAGRSFFTSIGKAVAAFEYGGILDPVTIRFGRLFASMRERARVGIPSDETNDEYVASTKLMLDLFGGHLRFVKDSEYVEATDGRKIPFSTLSSGQQELLPLWLTLRSFVGSGDSPRSPSRLIYIEEPEAHLFPSAQGMLLEYLVSLVSRDKLNRRMLITTHSPYVLAKLNNLITAGQVSRTRNKSKIAALEKIVPRSSWLQKGKISAYAIIDRKVSSVIDSDGLIDGEYLDSVSNDNSRDFLSMLELKYGASDEAVSND